MNSRFILSSQLLLIALSAASFARDFNHCELAYPGCMKPGSSCMPELNGLPEIKHGLSRAYARSPNHAVLLICKDWKTWKPVESFAEFKTNFDQEAKHWTIVVDGKPTGPFSRNQLVQLKDGQPVKGLSQFTLTPTTQVWSPVRMGSTPEYQSAGRIDELHFNVFTTSSTDDEIIL